MPSFLKYSEYYSEPVSTTTSYVGITPFVSQDGSGTIPAGGGAVLLFSGATPATGYEICNVDGVWDLWISDTTTAAANEAGSIRIGANGGTYTTPRDYRPLGPVSVFSNKPTGHKVTARAW